MRHHTLGDRTPTSAVLLRRAMRLKSMQPCTPRRNRRPGVTVRTSPRSGARPPVCRVSLRGLDHDLCGLDAGLRMPSTDVVCQIRHGLARERVALDELRDARQQIAAGIRIARERDHASWYAIARAIVPGGAGREPGAVHAERLELAKRLRQRSR